MTGGLRERLSDAGSLDHGDVGRLHALRALDGLELDPVALVERTVAVGVDGGEVSENVGGAVLGRDEAEALLSVEPLDGAGVHENLCPSDGRLYWAPS
ncbi:hypothetical protein SDC9_80944 [bioreactor metagenome]|uniref:Uncharacterized protein n=1 Tax=bioreactor metagenome TaxID=1076179 RepID=A0A644Z0V9_9ZZZZ